MFRSISLSVIILAMMLLFNVGVALSQDASESEI